MTLTRSPTPARAKFSRASRARSSSISIVTSMPPAGSAPREPDAGVADRGADFEDARGADRRRQHAQQRADLGVDQRQAARRVAARDLVEHRIARAVESREILLDGVRHDLAHRAILGSDSHAPHEDHRHRRAGERLRADARRADRGRHRHLPAQFLARHARVAGGDVRARPGGVRARRLRGRDPPGSRRPEDPHRPARGRPGRSRSMPGEHADDRHRRRRRRTGPALHDVRRARAGACAPAIGCCSPTAASSCASSRPTAPRFRRPSSKAARSASTRGSTRRACRCRRRRSRRRTSRI